MISYRKRFIFLHIPKTAGCSIMKALEQYKDTPEFAVGHPYLWEYDHVDQPTSNFYKFTCVRNPFDRLVSCFHYMQKGGCNKFDEQFRDRFSLHKQDFYSFVRNTLPVILENKDLRPRHFKPQSEYYDTGIDRVIRFEQLQSDFDLVCDDIKIPRVVLGHVNSSKHDAYSTYYDRQTMNIVSETYAQDFERFGYDNQIESVS